MDSNRLHAPNPSAPVTPDSIARLTETTKATRRDLRSGGWGLMASVIAATQPDWFVKAYITAIYPADADVHPYPAAQIYYDVIGVGLPDARINHDQPFYGRPVRSGTQMIYAASVDMDAVIVRSNDMTGEPRFRLMLLPDSEQRATRICGQE